MRESLSYKDLWGNICSITNIIEEDMQIDIISIYSMSYKLRK